MTIAKDFAAKLSVAIVAVAMVFSAFASSASAQTAEELQAMINDLLAQIAKLEATTSVSAGTGSCVSIMAPLTIGSTGADVTALQNRLIAWGEVIPAGATGYFGTQTQSALASWQGKNAVSPAVGYYGPITKAAMDAKCSDMDDSDDDMSLSGEGTLDTVEVDDSEDPEEGESDVEVMVVTLEADDDIEVDRMTFTASSTAGSETDPWDVFETISLWVDGDMIAEFDAEDEDEYLDEDTGEFRFNDLELILEEGEEVEVSVAVSVQNGVDDAGTAAWDLTLDEIRYFDADGVATDEDGPLGEIGDAINFTIETEGEGDDFDLSSSSEDPDAMTIAVEEDEEEAVGIFAFSLDADGSDDDIEVNELTLEVTTNIDADDFVNDFYLEIDGEEFDAESYTGGTTTTLVFDIDGDITVDADDELTAMLYAEIEVDENFNTATIQAATVSYEAEGADDIDANDTVTGEEHTVISTGIVVPQEGVSFDTSTSNDGNGNVIGTFDIEFEVTAFEGDFYIRDLASTTANATTEGVEFAVLDSQGNEVTTGVTAVLSTDGDEENGFFYVEEGETDTLTLSVTVDPSATGQFRVVLEEVWYDEDKTLGSADGRTLTPASDYRTGYVTIQG